MIDVKKLSNMRQTAKHMKPVILDQNLNVMTVNILPEILDISNNMYGYIVTIKSIRVVRA